MENISLVLWTNSTMVDDGSIMRFIVFTNGGIRTNWQNISYPEETVPTVQIFNNSLISVFGLHQLLMETTGSTLLNLHNLVAN